MLSRTADNLYWLARSVERAENQARLLEAAHRMATLTHDGSGTTNEWQSAIFSSGSAGAFAELYPDSADTVGNPKPQDVIAWLAQDVRNPSSIASCINNARHNARSVRTALTVDMWECLNDTWRTIQDGRLAELTPETLSPFVDWVKERTTLFRGAAGGTMLRNDAFYFTQLGMFLERADNTARILDVKFHVLLPQSEVVGGSTDYYQWSSLLRAMSALRSYHWVYRENIRPWLVAEFLILRAEMPRSLVNSLGQMSHYLDLLAEQYGARHECHRLVGSLYARLRYGNIKEIFQNGLHEFLLDFISKNSSIGNAVREAYLL